MNGKPVSRDGVSRDGYVRPMRGWWRRDPFFIRYMARELTAVAVLVYAVILSVGVLRLAQGEPAWNSWLAALHEPASMLLHFVLLAAMMVHSWSWFAIMPKTLPPMWVCGKRVEAATITRAGWAAAIVASIALLALAGWLR